MFQKLLSNLPFNPSLIGKVTFYTNRLRKETFVRRLGVFFIVAAMGLQLVAVIAPAEPSLAQDVNNDIIAGGFDNRDQAVLMCIDGNRDFGTILAHYGITCDAVANATTEWIQSTNDGGKILSMGRLAYGKPGEYAETIAGRTYYMKYLWAWDNGGPATTYKVLQGNRANGETFYILYDCGNPAIIETPPVAPPPPPPPTPEPFADCSIMLINYDSGTSVKKNTQIVVRGQVTGGNLPAGTTADLTYEYVNAATGQAAAPAIVTRGVLFENGIAIDPANRNFTVKDAGKFEFRLSATYQGGKEVRGSRQGRCISTIYVEQPDVCPDIPGDQTKESECQPCPESPDNKPIACLVYAKTARNDTQNIENADGTMAKAGDVITYTLSAKNTGKATVPKFVIAENISDILDYADVIDFHGGTMDNENMVRWPAGDIKPGETLSKKLTIKVKSPVPQTPVSASNPGKFDLTMTNTYEDTTVNIKLPPTTIKTTEQVTKSLPNTGPGETLVVGVVVTIIAGYFFARARLMVKELDLVRSDYAVSGGM